MLPKVKVAEEGQAEFIPFTHPVSLKAPVMAPAEVAINEGGAKEKWERLPRREEMREVVV